ncbi:hypothetical protein CF319_g7406 [Tilletia indica]|nr:hypothetical protein CF319_g7406 [Tilletia indica]
MDLSSSPPDDSWREYLLSQPAASQPPSSQPQHLAVNRIRLQLEAEAASSGSNNLSASETDPFRAETAFASSQGSRGRELDPLPQALTWEQEQPQGSRLSSTQRTSHHPTPFHTRAGESEPDEISAVLGMNHTPATRSGRSIESNPDGPSPSTDARAGVAPGHRRPDELQSAATLAALAHTPQPEGSSSRTLDRTSSQTPSKRTGLTSASASIQSRPRREWAYRDELANTPAQYYLGPLTASQVLSHLSSPTITQNARLALTGTHAGYLQYFHYLGLSSTPPARRRSASRDADGMDHSAEAPPTPPVKEWWQCRLCHVDFHVPPLKISNLGAHLYGSPNPLRRGCLDLRQSNPAEAIPAPLRDRLGAIIRIRPDKDIPASRAKSSRRES